MVEFNWPDLALQVGLTAGAAYAGVAARLARVEERVRSVEARADDAVAKVDAGATAIAHHVEVFHTHERVRSVR